MTERAYRIFEAFLTAKQMLTPHMARLTFGGEQIADMATRAPDQRIKLFFPKADGTPPAIPNRGDWYELYKAVPPADRPPMRTYTIRTLDADARELVIDFVMHGDNGPASRWAMHAAPGDRLQISAPNRRFDGAIGGFDWEPPAGLSQLLLIADETALPAVAGILDQIAGWTKKPATQAFIEVPGEADIIDLPAWDGLDLQWLPRVSADHAYGARMVAAAEMATIPASVLGGDATEFEAVDVDREILWDRAENAGSSFYGWIAGETAAVSRIRTLLVKEKRIDRRHLTMMGYWRHGKVHA
jgi:NADPH-dependent ferric siderophore reductase